MKSTHHLSTTDHQQSLVTANFPTSILISVLHRNNVLLSSPPIPVWTVPIPPHSLKLAGVRTLAWARPPTNKEKLTLWHPSCALRINYRLSWYHDQINQHKQRRRDTRKPNIWNTTSKYTLKWLPILLTKQIKATLSSPEQPLRGQKIFKQNSIFYVRSNFKIQCSQCNLHIQMCQLSVMSLTAS